MSVKVKALTKLYGEQKAIDQLNFEIAEGQIVGLLGPNGAGKSTTMKILTGYLPQSSGQAWVHGLDTEKQALEVRRLIGYLPESNPLYYDMYVREYLQYAGGFYKLDQLAKRVDQMIERTGLGIEQHKKIGQLSKGYKQRVGLAQALLHDPQVLVLDEPTSGLDPNQLADIRQLIREMGQAKTIILSTHIMQEVEAMCQRVIIINRGRLVADDAVKALQQRVKGETVVEVEFSQAINEADLRKQPYVSQLKKTGNNSYEVRSQGKEDLRQQLFAYAVAKQMSVLNMSKKENSLEEVFRELTNNKKK
jgi:ABC-2 type transport system ATP-binding protein